MKTKTSLLLSLLLFAAAGSPSLAALDSPLPEGAEARGETAAIATTDSFRIDLRPSPRKVEPGATETLAFSGRWADPENEAASVRIALDGAEFATLPGGEGAVDWMPDRGGLFTFTHTALDANGRALGVPNQASFFVDMSGVIPQDVTASDGTSEVCVEVSWKAVSGAVHEVWRGASDGAFAEAVKLGETEEGEWNDATAVPGVVYRYWVRALFGGVTSVPSDPDTGWRAIPNMFVGVTKEWDDNENEAGYRPESVRFTLVADGVDIATTNLSDSVGWTAIWTVPKYADGVGIDYSVREDNLPDAYDALVATNGCGRFKNVPANSNILTEYGWVQFKHANVNSNIWTESGWFRFKNTKVWKVVMTDYRGLGTMFCFTNRYMRPTRKTELAVSGWSGVYDGEPHGVEATSATVGASFLYATSEHGPYTTEKPTWREAGPSHETWVIAEARFFAPVTNKVTVTISPRPLAVTAAAKSKVYGEADPALTYTATGLVAGDTLTGALSRAKGETVGTYAIGQGSLAAGANYALSFAGADFTIRKAAIGGADKIRWSVSGEGTRWVYDGSEHSLTLAGLPAGVTATYTGNKATDAGEYSATAHLVYDTANYEAIPDPAPLAWGIDKRPATVRSADGAWVYDTTAHSAPKVETSGFVAGEGGTADGFASVTDVGETANSFSWHWNSGTKAENYALSQETGTLRVTARQIGDDARNWDIRLGRNPLYDGTEKAAPIVQVCYVKPNGNLVSIPYALSGDDKATDAGNYSVAISGTGNYAGSVSRDWAITPRTVSLASGDASWTYDGAAHEAPEVTVGGDGFAEGEGVDCTGFPRPVHVADTGAGLVNSFEYAFRSGTKAGNYVVSTNFGRVAVAPRAVTLSAPTKSKPYDGAPLTFGADEVAVGGDGCAHGESFALSGFASITDAGQVPATFVYASGTARTDDYAVSVAEGATLTVTRSATEIVVQAASAAWTYDGETHEKHEWTATNLDTLQSGDELEVAFDPAATIRTPVDGPAGDGNVPNAITAVRVLRGGEDVSANYSLAWYPGTLRVAPRPVVLTSASATKPYDGTPLVAREVAVGGDGFVGSDGATFSVSGTQTSKGSSANAFTWAFKAGTNPAFYDVSTVDGTLEVTALDIGGGDDGDWEIVLGPALEYNGIEQIQTLVAVRFRGLDVDYSVENDRGTDAGEYALTLVGQGDFAGTRDVPWSIAPKPLALVAGSAEKVYDGTPLVCGDVAATGFVPGEGAAYRCSGTRTDAGESANEVAEILWSDGTKGSNYAVSKTAGTLRVTPRAVTLTAPTKSKPYDGSPLTFGADEIKVDGIVAGDSFAFSGFAARTEAGQSPATFAYAAGSGTSLANYAVTVVPGTLTVARSAKEIVVQAASATWIYDGKPHEKREWTATNLDALVPGDVLDVEFDPASEIAKPGEAANAIATVRVLRDGADVSANYSLVWYPGTLRVTPRQIEVRVTGATAAHVYDGVQKTVSGYEIATDDALYDIAADTAFAGAASVSATDAGSYPMGLSAADFENANRCFDVTYRVSDGRLDITRADISDGGDLAVSLGDDPLYNGTVQAVEIKSATWRGLPVTYTLSGEVATHAGEYALTFRGTGNFDGEWTTTWRIRPRAVTLTSASAEKVYDGTPLASGAVAVTGDGFIGLEGATFDVTGAQTASGESANSFTYALKAGTLSGDYDIATVFGTLRVAKATHDTSGLGWNVAADVARFVYDGAEHGVALTGLPDGVTATYAGERATDAGEYSATAHLVYDTVNYEPIPDPAPLAWGIDKRQITLFAASKDKPYDGWPLEVKPEDITAAGSGYAPGECFAYGDFASITDVGEIPATFSYTDSATAKVANYDVTVQGGQTLKVTVGGDQISVTADSGTWVFDGETHRRPTWTLFNGDKLLPGHAFDIAISEESAVTTPAEGIVSNRFDHVRVVDADGVDRTRNYNLFVYEGTLQVTNALIAPLIGGALDRTVTAVYDGAAHSAAVEAPTLLTPATVRYRTAGGTWTGEAPSWTHAGEYEAEFEVSAEFYDSATGRVSVVIAPREVTLASPTKSKPYDGAPLTFAAGEIAVGGSGLVAGDSFVYSDFASITDAGRVDAAFDWAAGPGTLASDYAVTVAEGTLTVNRSATEIVVTAKDGQWVFDGTSHSLHEWTAENLDALVAGDELEVAFDRASAISEPGEVANTIVRVRVLRGGVDVTANYALSWWPGTLRMKRARISPSMIETGTSDTAIYDGLAHGVAVAAPALLTAPVTVRYAATADGPWGSAPAALTDAGAWTAFFRVEAPNYEPFVGTTTMTIAPREVTLVSAAATKVYDGTPLRKDEVAVKAGSLQFAAGEGFTARCTGVVTDVGGVENAFDYTLSAGTKAGNYTIRKEYGWLRVTPATMDLSALSAAASWHGPYDGEPHGAALAPPYPRAEVSYAAVSGDESAYGPESPTWTDVSTNAVFFKVVAPNYEPGYGRAIVEIAPRDIALAQIGTLENEFYTGYPIEPVPTVEDVVPITPDDWTVRWEDNVEAGTARAIVVGRRNYGGEAVREFEIELKPVVVVVIDLGNVEVGQGRWGSAVLTTNDVPVEVAAGSRVELELPQGTPVSLFFSPDPGFKIGSVIVDRRSWTTQAEWTFEAKADRSFQASYIPNPQTSVAWKKANATGHYHAQFSLPWFPGYGEALADLRFLFADRVQNGETYAQLWDYSEPAARRVADEVEIDGKIYRAVPLDVAAKTAALAPGARAVFGVSDATLASATAAVPSAERRIGLYIRKRISPVSGQETDAGVENFIGALAWETNGKTYYQPVGAGYDNGVIAEKILDAEDLDAAEALGFDPAFLATAEPSCRIADFVFDPVTGGIDGNFEIVATTPDGIEAVSSGTTDNAVMLLEAADSPTGPWTVVSDAAFPSAGDDGKPEFFADDTTGAAARFFRIRIEIRASHE